MAGSGERACKNIYHEGTKTRRKGERRLIHRLRRFSQIKGRGTD